MTRSTQELRLESERSRAELAATVEKLRERVADAAEDIRERASPDHIKSELSDVMRSKMGDWAQGLKQQAQENPIRAVAVGTTIAVPLLRAARGLPLPLLMIGAGLALTSKTVRDRAADAASPVFDKAGNMLDEASERAQGIKAGLQDRLSIVQSQAAGLGDDLAENLRSHAANAADVVSDEMRLGAEAAANVAGAAPGKARRIIGDNAAVIGGIGLTIGAVLASTFPATKVEAKVIGPASDNLKQAASEAAQSGFATARDATMSALDTAATRISEANVGDDISRVTDKLTDTLGQAADDVGRAAFTTSRNSNI